MNNLIHPESHRRFGRMLSLVTGTLTLMLAWSGPGAVSRAASLEEPATVFYGRIIGTGSEHPFLLTEGELRWTIVRANGQSLVLRAELWPLNNGEFSYRLNVPHEALIQGASTKPNSVALTSVEQTLGIGDVRINDLPARLAGPSADTFDVDQARRAATYRMDLEVTLAAPDSDGDGLPDWWEALHNADLKPGDDLDGDGLDNRAEYLGGSDPRADSRRPRLITTRVLAYADCTTGVHLRVLDTDTDPEDLVYTLVAPAAGFQLRLRNTQPDPDGPDAALAAGSTFTQQDVLDGRLILVPEEGLTVAGSEFQIALRDDEPDAAPVEATIVINLFQPSADMLGRLAGGPPTPDGLILASVDLRGLSRDEAFRFRNYHFGKARGAVLFDYSDADGALELSAPTTSLESAEYEAGYYPRFGLERPQALLGGRGSDILRGGVADDVLAGGGGENQLTGGGGRDCFLFVDAGNALDTVTDFQPEDGDVLDFGTLLKGSSPNLRDYIRVIPEGDGGRIVVDRDGDGSGYTDLTVVLPNVPAAALDLHDLLEAGALDAGALSLPPRMSIAASRSTARENGPDPGEFLVSRAGSVSDAVTVRLEVRGSALNGVDFASVPNTITLNAGVRTALVTVMPFADSQSEPAETVEVTIADGQGYEVNGRSNRAELTIADLQPVVSVEALEPFATTEPMAPGTVLVTRDTVTDRSLLVRLEFKGSAVSGTDFKSVSKFVNLVPGQTTALIPVEPSAGSLTSDQAKSVVVSVVPDSAYLIGSDAPAEVVLVRQRTTLADWRSNHFPEFAGSVAEFRAADPGGKGIANAFRYAFGMDPEQPDRARMPRAVVRDGHLTVDVWRRPGATDVDVEVVVGSDLGDWNSGSGAFSRIFPAEQVSNPELVCFRAGASVADAPQLFFKVRLVFKP